MGEQKHKLTKKLGVQKEGSQYQNWLWAGIHSREMVTAYLPICVSKAEPQRSQSQWTDGI